MTGFYKDNSNRRFVFFKANDTLCSFSIMYGIKGKSRKGDYAKELLPFVKEKQLKSVNKLNSIEKAICIRQAFNEWFYE